MTHEEPAVKVERVAGFAVLDGFAGNNVKAASEALSTLRATVTIEGETFGPWTLAEARCMADAVFGDFSYWAAQKGRIHHADHERLSRRYRAASAAVDALTGISGDTE